MLNYKQLYYFWHVARSGGVTRAAQQLHLTPQTISGQVAELEQSLGVALFNRVGRRLVLTAAGRQALEQAGAIFSLKVRLIARGEATLDPAAGVELIKRAWAAAADGRIRAAATAATGRRRNRDMGRSIGMSALPIPTRGAVSPLAKGVLTLP